MTADEIRAAISFGREQFGIEFKSPGLRSDKEFFAVVARAIMAMANHRDGGTVLIGIEDDGFALTLRGLDATEAASWRHDDVADALAEYVDPKVDFDTQIVPVDGVTIVVLEVNPFAEVPVLCRKTYVAPKAKSPTIREGACYVRSRRKPESREVCTLEEMRELLDLATDKSTRRFVERAQAAGLFDLGTAGKTVGADIDSQLFAKQAKDFK